MAPHLDAHDGGHGQSGDVASERVDDLDVVRWMVTKIAWVTGCGGRTIHIDRQPGAPDALQGANDHTRAPLLRGQTPSVLVQEVLRQWLAEEA
jgi:hypothetical protein